MQRIAHNATFKAGGGNYALSLSVQHVLRSPALHDENAESQFLEVISQNPLLFTLSGSKDGILATPDELVTSRTTNQLLEYLRKNASELGLDTISRIAVSPAVDAPGCELSFRNPGPSTNLHLLVVTVSFTHAHASEDLSIMQPRLQSLHLRYSWRTRPSTLHDTPSSEPHENPFSKDLTLPLQTLLDDVIVRFVKNSLQFNNEAAYFQPAITSINRIFKRSLDPVFRSQCGQLLKLLRHRYKSFSDMGHTTEFHGRHTTSRAIISTEAAFHLAMQCIFRAGMKCTAFKGTHGFVLDAEERELLETGPPEKHGLPLLAPSPPSDDLFPDKDEDSSKLELHKDKPPFVMLDFLDFGSSLALDPDVDEGFWDTESEDDVGIVDTDDLICSQKTSPGDITIDFDEDGEDECQQTVQSQSIGSSAASCGKNLSSVPISRQALEKTLGITGSSPNQGMPEIYAEQLDRPTSLDETEHAQELFSSPLFNYDLVGHDTHPARSGDSQTSQEKGNTSHMAGFTLQRTQVAPRDNLFTISPRASQVPPPLDLETRVQPPEMTEHALLGLDMDTDSENGGAFDFGAQTVGGLDEPRGSVRNEPSEEPTIRSQPNWFNHAPHHEEFLDVLSEGLYSDEELDMVDLYDRGEESAFYYIEDCIIGEGLITGSPLLQSSDESPSATGSELTGGETTIGSDIHCDLSTEPFHGDEDDFLVIVDDDREKDWSYETDGSEFVELLT